MIIKINYFFSIQIWLNETAHLEMSIDLIIKCPKKKKPGESLQRFRMKLKIWTPSNYEIVFKHNNNNF